MPLLVVLVEACQEARILMAVLYTTPRRPRLHRRSNMDSRRGRWGHRTHSSRSKGKSDSKLASVPLRLHCSRPRDGSTRTPRSRSMGPFLRQRLSIGWIKDISPKVCP